MAEPRRPFQFSLRTLLFVCVVLALSMAVFGASGIVVFLLVVGLAISLHQRTIWLFCTVGGLSLMWLVLPGLSDAVDAAHNAGVRASCTSNMEQLVSALRRYHAANGAFPPACTTDKSGKPLHSWRTLILPYVEQDDLYKSIDLAQPWDSPKNKTATASRPGIFHCLSDPSGRVPGSTQCDYFAIVGPGTAWDRSMRLAPTDAEASRTILLVEAANSGVSWAEPGDISLDALTASGSNSAAPFPSSGHGRREGSLPGDDEERLVCAAMADGNVQFIRLDHRSPDELRQLFQIGGCTKERLASGGGEATGTLNWRHLCALPLWFILVTLLLINAAWSSVVRREQATTTT